MEIAKAVASLERQKYEVKMSVGPGGENYYHVARKAESYVLKGTTLVALYEAGRLHSSGMKEEAATIAKADAAKAKHATA